LHSDGRLRRALDEEFEGTRRISVMRSPPLLARMDPATGRPRKISFGGWLFPVFRALAACRGLREGPFDIFGRTAERRMERELRDAYLAAIPRIAAGLDERSLPDAVALAEEALQVRGFGPVKAPA